jgi:hypothetical protein
MTVTDFDKLRLLSQVLTTSEVPHTLENTGGNVYVLYVPMPNDHHLGITVTDACMPWSRLDQLVFMLVCYDSSDADDEGVTMIEDASTPLALACVLEAVGNTFFTIPSSRS